MALFTGTFENKVDGKGRVSLPADYRDLLAEDPSRSFYVFPSPNTNCLEACDREFIQRVAESIEEQAEMFSEEEEGLSQIISSARRVSYDSTGRFVLPVEFQQFAKIADKAVFVGKAARFQIWNPEEYRSHADKARAKSKSLTLKLKRPGGAS